MDPAPVTDPAELARVHADLLVPSFPEDELDDLAALTAGVDRGTTEVLVLRDQDGPVAVAVGDWFPAARVVLLSYLATAAGRRSAGHGGRLLDFAVARWASRFDPCAVVAEVEDPEHHGATRYGDPGSRLRFYGRAGARMLDLPYLQPALRPGGRRVPHLLLLVLQVAPALLAGTSALRSDLVVRFLEDLFVASEGALPADPDGTALLAAAAVGDGVPLRPLPGAGG